MTETAYPKLQLFIGGAWRNGGGDVLPVMDPATGAVLAEMSAATRADLDDARSAVAGANKAWRAMSALDRGNILRRAGQILRKRSQEIGVVTTLEQGKPVAQSIAEVMASADIFDWYAEEARRAYGRVIPSKTANVRHLALKEPIGPALLMSPWNMPTTIPARKLGAALAAGCPVILKPAEETPGSALALAKALDDAGLPKGVLNIVFGSPADISSHLIAAPEIRKVSFTGSTVIGKHLAGLCAQVMKPATMELGGHAPVMIFEDADLDRAVATLVQQKFRNAGQICIAPTRFYVYESVHDAFVEKFATATKSLKVGAPLDPKSQMGPLANTRRVEAMESLIGDAETLGAKLFAGGAAISNQGNYWQPTLLADVPDAAKIMSVEPFGPVVVTQRFTTFDEVVQQANRLPFGLAAYAWTRDAQIVRDLGDAIEAGMLGINVGALTGPETPFGGVKESGYGSEGGSEGLEAYLVTKYVAEG